MTRTALIERHSVLRSLIALAGAVLLTSLLAGCSASEVLQTWRSPQFSGPGFHNLMVYAVPVRPELRHDYEDGLVRQLSARGVHAVASYTVFPDVRVSKADMLQVAAAAGADGVLFLRGSQRYLQPTYLPPRFQNPAEIGLPTATGVGTSQRDEVDPQVIGTNDIVMLQTRVYRSDNGQLVWFAGTKTYDLARLEHAVDDVSKAVAHQMVDEGIVGQPGLPSQAAIARAEPVEAIPAAAVLGPDRSGAPEQTVAQTPAATVAPYDPSNKFDLPW